MHARDSRGALKIARVIRALRDACIWLAPEFFAEIGNSLSNVMLLFQLHIKRLSKLMISFEFEKRSNTLGALVRLK